MKRVSFYLFCVQLLVGLFEWLNCVLVDFDVGCGYCGVEILVVVFLGCLFLS